MAETLIADIAVGPRYVRRYGNGRVEISAVKVTENPQPVKLVDKVPTLTKDQTATKLPPEKWTVKEDGTVEVVYKVEAVLRGIMDAKEAV